jgi:hypothetical protein
MLQELNLKKNMPPVILMLQRDHYVYREKSVVYEILYTYIYIFYRLLFFKCTNETFLLWICSNMSFYPASFFRSYPSPPPFSLLILSNEPNAYVLLLYRKLDIIKKIGLICQKIKINRGIM